MTGIRGVALAFAAAALVVAAACGGGENGDGNGEALSLEAYVAAVGELLDTLNEDVSTAGDEIFSGLDESAQEAEQVTATLEFLEVFATALDGFVSSMGDLEVPDEVRDEHEAFIGAVQAFREDLTRTAAEAGGTETQEELGQLLDEALTESAERLEGACNAIQSLADEQEIEVALNCRLE